jgi:hypothetical protein
MRQQPDAELPCRGKITELTGESGTIETSAGFIRFGVTACSAFTPSVGLDVWVISVKYLPIVGPRATLVNLTGTSDYESVEDRVRRDRERAWAAESAEFRLDDASMWLTAHPDRFAADRFSSAGSALAMVEELLGAGALRVALLGTGTDRTRPSSMEVEMPPDHDARAAIFTILGREWSDCGEDFAATPDGRPEPRELTPEQAAEMGVPYEAGALVGEEGPPVDAGQTVLTLWWD